MLKAVVAGIRLALMVPWTQVAVAEADVDFGEFTEVIAEALMKGFMFSGRLPLKADAPARAP